jgi:hypothetical protein
MNLPNPFGSPPLPSPGPPAVTQPLQIRKKAKPAAAAGAESELIAIQQELEEDGGIPPSLSQSPPVGTGLPESRTTGILATPPKKNSRKPAPSSSTSPLSPLPFRVIKPSLPTLEKATSVALFFEAFYTSLLKPPSSSNNYVLNRAKRFAQLEESFNSLENRFMSEGERQFRRDELVKEENRWLRDKRSRVDARAFEMGRVIGHGAFGVVRIAREKEGGRLVAMKQVCPGEPDYHGACARNIFRPS